MIANKTKLSNIELQIQVKLLLIHFLFLIIALFIAFALVPFDQVYFDNQPVEQVKQYYQDALEFKSSKAWKIVFTWFLGLSCGRLMVKALKDNTNTTKPANMKKDSDL